MWGLRPYPLRLQVEKAGGDTKIIQLGPPWVAYSFRHVICTVPVERITAHATMSGYFFIRHD